MSSDLERRQDPISTDEESNRPDLTSTDEDIKESKQQVPPQREAGSEWTLEACLTLAGACCVLFCTVGITNAFGVFQTYYAENLLSDKSASTISWLGSFNIFIMFAGTFPMGYLYDRYGPKWMLRIGSVILLFSFFMVSLCKEYWQLFLAQGLLFGVGIAITLSPAFTSVPRHFNKNRGLALGICVSGSSLGGVIWPIVLDHVLYKPGFGWGVRIVAFIMLPLMLIGALTIKVPKHQANMPKATPSFRILLNPVLILLSMGLFFIFLGLFTPFFYITSYSLSQNIEASMSFYMISIINASSLFGRVLPGIVADRVGFFNVMIVSVLMAAIICSCMTTATSLGGIVVLSLAYGFFSGAVISLQAACAATLVKREEMGLAIGGVMAVLSIAALIGTPITGQVLDAYGYLGVSLFSGLAMIIGAIILAIARLKKDSRLFAKV